MIKELFRQLGIGEWQPQKKQRNKSGYAQKYKPYKRPKHHHIRHPGGTYSKEEWKQIKDIEESYGRVISDAYK